MGPKKLVSSKKQKRSDAGPSFVPRPKANNFNQDKFLEPEKQERYRDLASRNIWFVRTFNINPQGEFRNCLEIIEGSN